MLKLVTFDWCFPQFVKQDGEKTVNLSVRIYINNVEKRITFKIQTRFYHELLTP